MTVAKISLTDLVDVVSCVGTVKATKVRHLKDRPHYAPATDYYKQLRDKLIEASQGEMTKAALMNLAQGHSNKKKRANYADIVKGFNKWLGHKELEWFQPPTALFNRYDISVSVNPELGLFVNGQPHVIKLYFKSTPLAKRNADIITHLMKLRLKKQSPPGATMSVLDTRRSKLISPTVLVPGLTYALEGELAYIAALWTRMAA